MYGDQYYELLLNNKFPFEFPLINIDSTNQSN